MTRQTSHVDQQTLTSSIWSNSLTSSVDQYSNNLMTSSNEAIRFKLIKSTISNQFSLVVTCGQSLRQENVILSGREWSRTGLMSYRWQREKNLDNKVDGIYLMKKISFRESWRQNDKWTSSMKLRWNSQIHLISLKISHKQDIRYSKQIYLGLKI